MESFRAITIQQTLHGYSTGHNLLAASCDLSPEEKRALLLMSDLSGSGMQTHFETYLTGYLLPGNRYYVLARTWYASEMRRPGSVWTHSLLIDLALLGQFRWLHVLTTFHQRPFSDNYDFFYKSIDASNFITNDPSFNALVLEQFNTEQTRKYLSLLIHELYANASQQLVIPAENSSAFELTILTIWSQQWPRLRRNFSFCSGSLSIRHLNDEILDLQVIPIGLERSLSRRSYDINIVDINNINSNILSSKQISEFFSDDILKFMYQYGSDIDGIRSKYIPLSISYHYLNDNLNKTPYNVLFKYIFSTFHVSKEAKLLKKRILNENFKLTRNEAEDLFDFILNQPNSLDSDTIKTVIPYLILTLWNTGSINKDNFSEIFTNSLFNLLSNSDLGKLLKTIPLDFWITSPWITDDLLFETICNDSNLKESPLPWTMSLPIQQQWFDVLSKINVDNMQAVTRAMLHSGNGLWVNDIESKAGYKCILWALDWANESNLVLPFEWESRIPEYIKFYIHWLYKQADFSEYIISILDKYFTPYDVRLSFIDHTYWNKICTTTINHSYSEQSLESTAFLVTFGLVRDLSDPQLLISSLFQPLHDLAEHNLLTKKTWGYIERLEENRPHRLISVSLWDMLVGAKHYSVPYWDKCEHLRQLLVDYWILYDWSELYFLEAITKPDTFERTVRYCASFKEGKKFLIKLRNVAKASPDKLRARQVRIINKIM